MKQLSPMEGFVLSLGSGHRKRRMQRALAPNEALVPLELGLADVMVDLDPGVISRDSGLLVDVV